MLGAGLDVIMLSAASEDDNKGPSKFSRNKGWPREW